MNFIILSILQSLFAFKYSIPCSRDNVCPSETGCCSKYGFCGVGSTYCGSGCNEQGSFEGKCSARAETKSDSNSACSNSFKVDFSQGKSDKFTYDGPHEFKDGRLVMKIIQGDTKNKETDILMGYGTTVKSLDKYLYGKYSFRLNSGRVGGVVTAFTLMSDSKDEIDWEWVGKNESEVQTNYYSKGDLDYTKGAYFKTSFNTHNEIHDYELSWTPEFISWSIDGFEIRRVYKQDTKDASGNYKFPSTPSRINFSMWDGGSGAQGTKDWAGGKINWDDAEIRANGGHVSSTIQSISFQCN